MKEIVIKVSGKMIRDHIIDEIGKIKEKGINVILVHGGGVQIDKKVREILKKEPEFDENTGLRLTDEKTLEIVVSVLEEINRDIVRKMVEKGIPAEGFNIEKKVFEGKALGNKIGRYGRIVKVNTEEIKRALEKKVLPVVSPIGYDEYGALNLNADDAAVMLAHALNLNEIIILSNIDAIKIGNKEINKICRFCSQHLDALMSIVGKGMKEKIYACYLASKLGIDVKIVNGDRENTILNALSENGFGIMCLSPFKRV